MRSRIILELQNKGFILSMKTISVCMKVVSVGSMSDSKDMTTNKLQALETYIRKNPGKSLAFTDTSCDGNSNKCKVLVNTFGKLLDSLWKTGLIQGSVYDEFLHKDQVENMGIFIVKGLNEKKYPIFLLLVTPKEDLKKEELNKFISWTNSIMSDYNLDCLNLPA